MTALVWTRSPLAGEMVALALSRADIPVTTIPSKDAVGSVIAAVDGPAALVLGPSFSLEEARSLGETLAHEAPRLRVVLIEDLLRPLPCRVVLDGVPTEVLTMPLRVRTLLEAVRGPAMT